TPFSVRELSRKSLASAGMSAPLFRLRLARPWPANWPKEAGKKLRTMPVIFNVRHLEENNLVLKDELPIAELDLEEADELIHLPGPLSYDLQVQKLEKGILVQGALQVTLQCECARCLKSYP